jgi:uncharacterized YccA/Bax inhibitor family protein
MSIKEKTLWAAITTLFLAIVAIIGEETTSAFWPAIVGFMAVVSGFFTGILFFEIRENR